MIGLFCVTVYFVFTFDRRRIRKRDVPWRGQRNGGKVATDFEYPPRDYFETVRTPKAKFPVNDGKWDIGEENRGHIAGPESLGLHCLN